MSVKPDTSSTDPGVTTPPTDEQRCTSCGFVSAHQIHRNNPFGAGHTFRPPAATAAPRAQITNRDPKREAVMSWLYRKTGLNEDDLPRHADDLLDAIRAAGAE